jgi:hypothetical protein
VYVALGLGALVGFLGTVIGFVYGWVQGVIR